MTVVIAPAVAVTSDAAPLALELGIGEAARRVDHDAVVGPPDATPDRPEPVHRSRCVKALRDLFLAVPSLVPEAIVVVVEIDPVDVALDAEHHVSALQVVAGLHTERERILIVGKAPALGEELVVIPELAVELAGL